LSASLENVVPLSHESEMEIEMREDEASRVPPGHRDWSASLNLIKRAGETAKAAEDQTHKIIVRAEATLHRANEELEAAHHRIAIAEERMRAAELRAERAELLAREAQAVAQGAEARAREAEEWLERIHRAVVSEFSPGYIQRH
jgi:hypothetical protein